MKKIVFCIMLLIVSIVTFSQQTTPSRVLTRQDYLQKSKDQKIVAWSLLGGGVGLFLIARFVIPQGDPNPPPTAPPGVLLIYTRTYKNDGIKSTIGLTGLLSSIISIPLFISSEKTHRMGIHLFFINEPSHQIQGSGIVSRPVPSLALKLSL